MDAYHALVEGLRTHQQTLATDPIVTPLIVRVQAGALPEEFTEEEQFRIRLNYVSLLTLWEGLYRSFETGVLPEDALAAVGQGARSTTRTSEPCGLMSARRTQGVS